MLSLMKMKTKMKLTQTDYCSITLLVCRCIVIMNIVESVTLKPDFLILFVSCSRVTTETTERVIIKYIFTLSKCQLKDNTVFLT